MTYTEIKKDYILFKLKDIKDQIQIDFMLDILFLLINDYTVYVLQHENKKYIIYDK